MNNKNRVELNRGDNLANLLPLLSEGFCGDCKTLLRNQLQNLYFTSRFDGNYEIISSLPSSNGGSIEVIGEEIDGVSLIDEVENGESRDLSLNTGVESVDSEINNGEFDEKVSVSGVDGEVINGREFDEKVFVSGVDNMEKSDNLMGEGSLDLIGEENERTRFSQVGRKKDFVHYEHVGWKKTNVLQGLELHTRVFDAEEQNMIVNYVYSLQCMGQAGKLRERTYSEPRKWMRGKGRVTIQFGCCYNYVMDKDGNPPGILRDEQVDPLPSLFKSMIRRLVRWYILPPTCIPNSCIVNIYDEGDCIPPHIDHHDFLRPFCTVSFLTECNILFGSSLKIAGPGEFSGPVKVALPVGSVLILNDNGADVAKHCVPAVPAKRISITFRKMDESKLPYKFQPDPELQGIQPIAKSLPLIKSSAEPTVKEAVPSAKPVMNDVAAEEPVKSLFNLEDDFPPLGSGNKPKSKHR